jgi:hypothetical protein
MDFRIFKVMERKDICFREEKRGAERRLERRGNSAPEQEFLSPEVTLFHETLKEGLLCWLSLMVGQRLQTWSIE